MEREGVTAQSLIETSSAYWLSCTLQAAVKLRIFTALGEGAKTAEETAAAVGGSLRGTRLLLNALTAMGLLEREGEGYRNTAAARDFLCQDAPGYVGHIIMHHHHLLPSWAALAEAVRTGLPRRDEAFWEQEGVRESFVLGMYDLALRRGPAIARCLPLAGRRRLLDLGGGTGIYAVLFCREYPGLTAVVFDLPQNRTLAEGTVARFGMAGRVAFRGGDFLADDLGGPYDCAWLSQILHGEGPKNCRLLIRRAAEALAPGGLILVHEFLLADTADAPLHPALFSLNMLVGTREGRAYTEGEIREALGEAGFTDVRRLDYPSPQGAGIIAAVKGGGT
ncbi:MAG TPA: methyltransferase [Syntrophales bacterium]|nr:methyltransferase [Syntrophales bacterium]HON99023.1 methyltransferase [Syntrophales bacterium]HPC00513.1 methyltransferase [Syntrophales bacterium]HPQ05596.1 methyltransferase [Syntrophales bacterium]HRS86068.1 methyltransferase [Syntrophales bacterium]